MNLLNFTYPILNALQHGKVIRYYIAWLLRILGVAIDLGALYAIIQLLKMSLREGTDATFTIAGLLACAIIFFAAIILLQICLYRADKIIQLGDSEFTVIPIISQYLRWLGEVLAAVIVTVGVTALVFFVFVGTHGYNPGLEYLPRSLRYADSPILIFIGIPLITVCYSLSCIMLFYFFAELVNVNVDMARNLRTLVENQSGSTTQQPDTNQTKPTSQDSTFCANCGTPNIAGDAFCANCGNQL